MLHDECESGSDEDDAEYDQMDMNIVKQLIGLKINDGNEANVSSGGTTSNGLATKLNDILCNSNKVYDFKEPSSKVSNLMHKMETIEC